MLEYLLAAFSEFIQLVMGPMYSLMNILNLIIGKTEDKKDFEKAQEKFKEKQMQKKRSMEERLQKSEKELAIKMVERKIEN